MQQVQTALQKQFDKMCKSGTLYRSAVPGSDVWDTYLNAFSPQNNPTFRDPNSSTHNCNTCNSFVRRYGNIIAFDNKLNIMTIWDANVDSEYADSFKACSNLLKANNVDTVFVETLSNLTSLQYETVSVSQKKYRLGIPANIKTYNKEEADKFGVVKNKESRTFYHLTLELPAKFVTSTNDSINAITGKYRSYFGVLKTALNEMTVDSIELAIELAEQNSFLDAVPFIKNGKSFLKVLQQYVTLPASINKDRWIWKTSLLLGEGCRFKNSLFGTACMDIAKSEKSLERICTEWNKRVDPTNFKRATAPVSQRQLNSDVKAIKELGYGESFSREFATIEDIMASEILHMNSSDVESVGDGSILDVVTSSNTQRASIKEEGKGKAISIDKFMETVLPQSRQLEVLFLNKHENNLVNLLKSANNDKNVLRWNNKFNWTYNGNLEGKSRIAESVKSQGGNVDNAVLRFSIMWADDNDSDNSDLDAHAEETPGKKIYYSNRKSTATGGVLDIDITQPQSHKRSGRNVVENIAYSDINKLKGRSIKFLVHQFAARNSQGFKAEIAFNGELYEYTYNNPVKGKVTVATVNIDKDGNISIVHSLPSSSSDKEIYGLNTNRFQTVNLVCKSPNHWGENSDGNKHFFFMMKGCRNEKKVRTFHIDNLKSDLKPYRKTLEVIAQKSMIEPAEQQLAGLGFNATVRDSVTVRVTDKKNKKQQYVINF